MEASINNNSKTLWIITETYSEPSETSKMEVFVKIVDCIQPLTIFEKHFLLGVLQGYEYDSDKTKQNLGRLSFISHKIRAVISANFFHF